MKITETVLVVNNNAVYVAACQQLILSEAQAVVHVLVASTQVRLSRNELRATVRPRREDILRYYKKQSSDLSHSIAYGDNVAILALRPYGAIGVDIEPYSVTPRAHIAERFFTPHERQMLQDVAEGPAREKAFRNLWTLKEAALKCAGGTVPTNLADVWTQTALPASFPAPIAIGWNKHFLKAGNTPTTALLFEPCANHVATVVCSDAMQKSIV